MTKKKYSLEKTIKKGLIKNPINLSKKTISFGKTTAIKIKQNPKQAICYGLRIKILDSLITGLIFSYGTINYHKKIDLNPITYKSPMIKNNSKEELDYFFEKISKQKYEL